MIFLLQLLNEICYQNSFLKLIIQDVVEMLLINGNKKVHFIVKQIYFLAMLRI